MSLFSKKINLLYIALPLLLAMTFFSLVNRNFRRAPWYEEIFWNLISPPVSFFSSISSKVGGVWQGYMALVGVREENESLKARLAELEQKQIENELTSAENARLKSLLNYHDMFSKRTVTARVISNDMRPEFRSAVINRGFLDGVRPLMPVLGARGLVGKIGRVTENSALVIFITDPNSAVDATVTRSRERGMVVGTAWHAGFKAGYYLTRLEYLNSQSDVAENDTVVTSGLDGVFPPGIPIGTLSGIKTSHYGVFREAMIVPFEDMAELSEVLVVLNDAMISKK